MNLDLELNKKLREILNKEHNFEEFLGLYKAELKKGIRKVHLSLHCMELDYYFEKEAVD